MITYLYNQSNKCSNHLGLALIAMGIDVFQTQMKAKTKFLTGGLDTEDMDR